MADLLDKLNCDGEITYKRCGEVVVAPDRNVFAMYCILCEDIFVDVCEFFRHVRRQHDDEFEFQTSQEEDVETYSLEELLNGMTCKDIIADEDLKWRRKKDSSKMELFKLDDTEGIVFQYFDKQQTHIEYEEEYEQEISKALRDDLDNKALKSVSKKSTARHFRNVADGDVEKDAVEENALVESVEQTALDEAVEAGALLDDAVEKTMINKAFKENDVGKHAVSQKNGKGDIVEEDPGLEDLLNELSEDLDCIDTSVFKKFTHHTFENKDKEIDLQLENGELPIETLSNYRSLLEDANLINDLTLILKSEKESFADENKHELNKIKPIHKVSIGENKNTNLFTKQNVNSLPAVSNIKQELHTTFVNNTNISKINIKNCSTEPSKTLSKHLVKSSVYGCGNAKLTKNTRDKNGSCAVKSKSGEDIRYIHKSMQQSLENNSRKQTQATIESLSRRPFNNSSYNHSSIQNVICKGKSEAFTCTAVEQNNQSSNESKQKNSFGNNDIKKILENPVAQKTVPYKNKINSIMKLNEKESLSEQKFYKTVKVRVKKLSPSSSPEGGHSDDLNNKNVNYLSKNLNKRFTQSKMIGSTTDKTQNRDSFMAAKTEALPMVTSPTTNHFFCKQNFTEQSLKAKIGTSSITAKQGKKPSLISGSRQRKASIDVFQETPFCSKEINRSARKNQVLQRMSKIRKRITKIIDKENEVCCKEQNNSELIEIKDVEILSPIPLDIISNYSAKESFLDFKKPMVNLEKGNTKVKATTTPRPLVSKLKDQQPLITNVEKNSRDKSGDDMETPTLDLSESIFEYMEQDLCQDKIDVNQIGSIWETTSADGVNTSTQKTDVSSNKLILEELLEQVDKEKPVTTEPQNDKNRQNLSEVKSAHQEMELLDKIGLKIVMNSGDEFKPLHEEESMRFKAKQFAEILRNYPLAWKNSRLPNNSPSFELCFVKMTKMINDDLKLNFTSGDTKRILNLIICWYIKQCSNKLINKKEYPETLKFYMEIFSFLPKTGRPFLNCEFCDLQFRTEGTYFTHRCTHTGGHPYSCVRCGRGFKRQGALKTHELSHTDTNKEQQIQKSKEINQKSHVAESPKKYIENQKAKLKRVLSPENTKIENNPKRIRTDNWNYKCDICSTVLQSPSSLYKHKMLHLKSVFNCQICKKVLPTSADLKKHMDTFHNNNIYTAKRLSLRQKKV